MLPQVRDALVGKLHRRRKPELNGLEPKDLRAFLRVQELSGGHPTEAELLQDILLCPYAWHLQMSGAVTDFRRNLEVLWPVLYHKPLQVQQQIIRPLLHELELSGYTESQDWYELVRALAPHAALRREGWHDLPRCLEECSLVAHVLPHRTLISPQPYPCNGTTETPGTQREESC